MSTALIMLALLGALMAALFYFGNRERLSGRKEEKLKALEVNLEQVDAARRARDDVAAGGGVPIERDPFNRDNRLP